MKRPRSGAIGLLAVCASLAGSANASAATEVGNDCAGTEGVQGVSFVQLSAAPGGRLPPTAPTAGVVTQWKVTLEQHEVEPFEEKLKVYRATASATQFTVVGESAMEAVALGPNRFDTRIPVKAGDRFGLFGETPSGPLNCATSSPQDVIGQALGDAPPGSTQDLKKESPGKRVAVSAVVEPDVDGDGFGDETQDRCPRSAAIQLVPCPIVKLASFALARKGSALLLVASDQDVPVTVSGAVSLPRGTKRGARASAQIQLSPVTQRVAPGQIAQFELRFPKGLRSALARLPRRRSLSLSLEARATDLVGVTTSAAGVRLKGQAPRRR